MRVALAILAITALSFFVFPGHTYLQQDTQIYVPILENRWSGELNGDLLVERPHVNFTLYDELTNGLRWITRAPLKFVLEGEQLIFRAIGFLGVYLIALALGLDSAAAIVVTAIWGLGAAITAAAVLTIEYEPTPRSFAAPLLLLATGLNLHGRYWWAGIAGASAFLLHAPTTWPFWIVLLGLAFLRRGAGFGFVPLLIAAIALVWIGFAQPVEEPQHFFDRLTAQQESLQRMRASYNYVSTWWTDWTGQYIFFSLGAFLALWRIRASREIWILLGGLVAAGLLSMPLSWMLLEHARLAIVPQIQPTRALLFVTAVAVIAAAAAGCVATNRDRWTEAAPWFGFALLVPVQAKFFEWPGWRVVLIVVGFSFILALSKPRARVLAALLLAPAIAIPGGVVAYRNIDAPELAALASWAKSNTSPGAVFAFPDAGHDRAPGWFRAKAARPVYVDWKAGGQVNYLRDFGYEWWRRWNSVMEAPLSIGGYKRLGIDYIVCRKPIPDSFEPVYRNASYCVYRVRAN